MSDIMTDDAVQQFFTSALAALSYPVSQPPGESEAETYVVFQEVSGSAWMASNEAARVRHLVQLHAFSRADDDEHRKAFFAALALLKAAGVRVFSWGPDDYETDTGIHHIACTCTWWQAPERKPEREDESNG